MLRRKEQRNDSDPLLLAIVTIYKRVLLDIQADYCDTSAQRRLAGERASFVPGAQSVYGPDASCQPPHRKAAGSKNPAS